MYDLEGRKLQETRTGGDLATETSSYTYDSLGRLDTVTLPDGTVHDYRFDLDSNRVGIDETPSGGTTSTVAQFTYDPANGNSRGVDQLTSVTRGGETTTFAHTADGQISEYGEDILTWDGWGRMTGGTFAGTSVSYGHDAMGRLRTRTSSGVTTRYLYVSAADGSVFETDTSGTIQLTGIGGPGGDLAHYEGPPSTSSPIVYRYYNGHGDLAATADFTGARISAFTYDAFGAPNQSLPTNRAVERWAGRWDKQLDSSTSFVQMGVRPYDPALGRFLAIDPLKGVALNSYDYSRQDPVNSYDLDGRKPHVYACNGTARLWSSIGVIPRIIRLMLTIGCNEPTEITAGFTLKRYDFDTEKYITVKSKIFSKKLPGGMKLRNVGPLRKTCGAGSRWRGRIVYKVVSLIHGHVAGNRVNVPRNPDGYIDCV